MEFELSPHEKKASPLKAKIYSYSKVAEDDFVGEGDKRFFFMDNEIMTIFKIEYKYSGNGILHFKDNEDLQIWYSQLSRRVLWDENGILKPTLLRINNREYDLSKTSIKTFENLVINVPLKALFQGYYYYVYKEFEREKAQILQYFRNQEFEKIVSRFRTYRLYYLEAL